MKKNVKKLTLLLAAMSLVSIVCATRVEADYKISFSASAQGLSINYHLPLIATGAINNLNVGDPSKTINLSLFLVPIATIELSVTAIDQTTEPPTLTLHYIYTSALSGGGDPTEADLTIPFCSAGLQIGLFKLFGVPKTGDDVDAFLLLTNNKTDYNISIKNTDTITGGSWTGTATPDASTNTATVIAKFNVNTHQYTATLTFDYSVPLVTKLSYSISTDEGDPITGGPIPLPNGRYKLWLDLPVFFQE